MTSAKGEKTSRITFIFSLSLGHPSAVPLSATIRIVKQTYHKFCSITNMVHIWHHKRELLLMGVQESKSLFSSSLVVSELKWRHKCFAWDSHQFQHCLLLPQSYQSFGPLVSQSTIHLVLVSPLTACLITLQVQMFIVTSHFGDGLMASFTEELEQGRAAYWWAS